MTIAPINGPRGQIYVRTEKLDNLLQFLLSRNPKDSSHSLYLDKNVTFTANVRIDAINIDKPSGYPIYVLNSSVGGTNVYTSNNATMLGKRWADWLEFFGYIRGMGEYPTGLYAGAIRAKNLGVMSLTGKSLMFDPADSTSTGVNSPYHAEAILEDSGTLPDGSLTICDYMRTALSSLKSELDSRNLCYPRYMTQDLPELLSYGAGLGGWAVGAFESSRYKTETVYREWNGTAFVNKTLEQAFLEAGEPTYNKSQQWDQGINRDFNIRMQPYINRINDHALSFTVYQNAKTYFPGILTGNYSICQPLSSEDQQKQYWEKQNNWFRYPKTSFSNKRYLEADFQSPDIYSPDMNSNSLSGYSEIYNTGYPAPTSGGHIFGNSNQYVYRNYCSQMVYACSLLENCLPIFPWSEAPHEQIKESSYPVYDANESDMIYIWQQNYTNGSTRWIIDNESQNTETTELAKTRSDQLYSTIISMSSWVKSLNRITRIRKVS